MALKGFWRKKQAHGTYGPIGVELGLEQFNLVQLRRAKSTPDDSQSLEVAAFASSPVDGDLQHLLDEGTEFVRSLKQGLKAAKFHGKRATVAMPSSSVRVMPLTYHLAPGQTHGSAILSLMQERIGDALNDFVLDYMPVDKQNNERQHLALVAMCRRETVVSFLERIRESGLIVEALEIGPIAIQRLVAELQHADSSDNVLVVNCGQEHSYLTLIAGGRLLSDEEVDFGEKLVVDRVSSILDMPHSLALETLRQANLDQHSWQDEAQAEIGTTLVELLRPAISGLVQEIQRALVFANSESRGRTSNEVYLLGSVARWQGSEALLASMLQVPVRKVPNPFSNFVHASDPSGAGMPELAVATGLALKGLQQAATVSEPEPLSGDAVA